MYYTALSVIFNEHGHSLKESFLERSKLAEVAYERGWKEAKILQTETISRYRK
jgi:hypothetical protein